MFILQYYCTLITTLLTINNIIDKINISEYKLICLKSKYKRSIYLINKIFLNKFNIFMFACIAIINVYSILIDTTYIVNLVMLFSILIFSNVFLNQIRIVLFFILYSIASIPYLLFDFTLITYILFYLTELILIFLCYTYKSSVFDYLRVSIKFNKIMEYKQILIVFFVPVSTILLEIFNIKIFNTELVFGYYLLYILFTLELKFSESSKSYKKIFQNRLNLFMLKQKRVIMNFFNTVKFRGIFVQILIILFFLFSIGLWKNNLISYISTILIIFLNFLFVIDVIISFYIQSTSIVYSNKIAKSFINIFLNFILFCTIIFVIIENNLINHILSLDENIVNFLNATQYVNEIMCIVFFVACVSYIRLIKRRVRLNNDKN